MSDDQHEHEETFEPATLGATPSSADALEERVAPVGMSSWPMYALGLVLLVDQMDQSIVRGMVTSLKDHFQVGDFQIGLLTSAFLLVNGVITLPAGYLADRWHRTRTIGHTVLGWSAITALGAAAPNFPALVALRAGLGFGQGITEPSAGSLLADYYPIERRGRAFSIQQILLFVGIGSGIGIGGFISSNWGWRWGFFVAGLPGLIVAFVAYRLKEPKRGAADRLHLGIEDDDSIEAELGQPLFDHGFNAFVRDMWDGLKADLRTIMRITTMRYALVGIAVLQFTVFGISTWLPQFYERQMHVATGRAEGVVGALIILGGIPGILLGGRIADLFNDRVRGARMAIPAYCIMIGTTFFAVSYIHMPLAAVFIMQMLGLFVIVMAIPALRAGLSDALPANLRGAGFGAFNIVTVVLGAASAPLIVSALSQIFDDNLRTAFLIVTPPVYLGAFILLKARDHLEADTAKIFEAIMTAMQEQQEREAREAAEREADNA
ncbi:MAG TPA: MFS transporter [Acidimicrobiales bacterium]|nr:MFS transporter [Acidimicrobiales bacterium]